VDENLKLKMDAEVNLYVDSFITSSNRVRYAIIIITVASILLFVGHHNSESDSWFNSRLRLANVALHERVWEYQPGVLKGEAKMARRWAAARGFTSKEEIWEHIKSLDSARTNRLLLLDWPFFGVSHDVNDLGFFGSIALLVLMLMLTFAMARQHENLYLALWRIRRVFDAEGNVESPKSQANLLYHVLAMSQQFSQPPTLARWKAMKLRGMSRLLLPLPLVVQVFCFVRDWKTRHLGRMVNPHATNLSLNMQMIALVLVLVMVVACFLYTRSNDIRWETNFYRLNPSFRSQAQPSWFEWVQLRKPKKDYCTPSHSGGLATQGNTEPRAVA
jgi:hypothetical protein